MPSLDLPSAKGNGEWQWRKQAIGLGPTDTSGAPYLTTRELRMYGNPEIFTENEAPNALQIDLQHFIQIPGGNRILLLRRLGSVGAGTLPPRLFYHSLTE